MSFKKKDPYLYRFEQFVLEFSKSNNLFNKDSKLVLALSGGVDSMPSLAMVLKSFSSKGEISSLRFIHFDHGTRDEIKSEVAFLKKFTKGFEFKSIKLDLSMDMANFESIARNKRLEGN